MGPEPFALNRDALPRIDLNQARREEQRRILARSRRDIGGFCLLTVFATALIPLTLRARDDYRQCAGMRREAERAEKRLQTAAASNADIERDQNRWVRFVQTRDQRQTWRDALNSLSARLPDDVFLDQIQMEAKDDTAEAVLTGSAATVDSLRTFTDRLEQSPLFPRVQLRRMSRDTTPTGVQFQVTARLDGALGSGGDTGKH